MGENVFLQAPHSWRHLGELTHAQSMLLSSLTAWSMMSAVQTERLFQDVLDKSPMFC